MFGVSPSSVEFNEVVVQANPYLIRNLHHRHRLIFAVEQGDFIVELVLIPGVVVIYAYHRVLAQTKLLRSLAVLELKSIGVIVPELIEHLANLVGEVPGRVERFVFCQFHTLMS